MRIGFDLDRVFINYPPLVPAKLIDWLYRDPTQKKLTYRIPSSKLEQLIRRLSHFSLLRPPLTKNITFLNNFPINPHPHTLYLISSRYKFLEHLTWKALTKYNLKMPFTKIFLNVKDEQPHFFKTKIIKSLKLDLYIDDDLDLLRYLYQNCPQTKFFWYNPKDKKRLHNGIIKISDLEELKSYLN